MFSRRHKTAYFILEALQSFSATFYFGYLYFFLEKAHGFGNQANLLVAALNGLTYGLTACWGGKFAQRFGGFTSLKLGFGLMLSALALNSFAQAAPVQIALSAVAMLSLSFIWPALEALISENEPRAGLQHVVGLYNIVWAATAAAATFIGGALLEHLGPRSLFFIPITILLAQLGLTLWIEKTRATVRESKVAPSAPAEEIPQAPASAAGFLRMAWLANPFAYIAINTLVAVIPGIAHRLELSTMLAGFCCSVWCFARLGTFIGLWLWPGWHYRFRWLLTAFVLLIAGFAAIMLVPSLAALILAQLVFGAAIGLIYYSSLFYSMDLSEAKGEHGGIHEAAIGLGNFAGPSVGAAALQFLPHQSTSGAVAVSFLLFGGLFGLLAIWRSIVPAREARLAALPAAPRPRLTASR